MKNFLFFTLLLGLLNTTQATTYYFSSSQGQDNNDGTSEATPWQSLDKLQTVKLPDHSTLLFKRQDTFRGIIKPSKFPIGATIGAYGQGDNPIISGSLLITQWKPTTHPALSKKVYEADLSSLALPSLQHLFVNKELMTIARYPNVPNPKAKNWLKVGATAGQDAFTDPVLAAYKKPNSYWRGATLRIRTYSWMYNIFPITGYEASSGKITAKGLGNQFPEWGYFLDGKLEELDFPGEWFYDASTKKVYLYPPQGIDLNQAQVEGAVQEVSLNLSMDVQEVTVENLTFQHFTKAIHVGAAKHITIRHCRFEHNGSGITSWQTNPILIEDNVFDHQFKVAIGLSGDVSSDVNHSIAQNNFITHTGAYRVYGERTQGLYQGIGILVGGRANTLRQNTIEYSSHAGIFLEGPGYNLIEHNVVRHSQQLLNDGGGIVISTDGNILRGNFILDSLGNVDESNGCARTSNVPPCPHHASYGMGIGSNSGFKENIIEGNTVANHPHYGIRLNGFNHSQVRNNISYNNGAQIYVEDMEGKVGSSFENVVEGNIIYVLNPEQRGLRLKSNAETTPHGRFDNNYYCNPYNEIVIMGNNDRKYSLAHWRQTYPNRELHSKGCSWKLKQYQVLSSGKNLIKNSSFDKDTTPWKGGNYDLMQSQLEGGSLRLVLPEKSNIGFVVHGDLSLQENQFYRMRLSVVGSGFGNIEWTMNDALNTGALIQFKRLLPYDVGRRDYDEVFLFPRTTSKGQLFLMMRSYDASPFWVDNISLEPVNAIMEDATKQSVLFTNPSDHSVNIDLGTIKYLDLDGNEVMFHFTLPPFSSQILVAVGTISNHPAILTIAKSGEGSGTVTSSAGLGEGIDCGVRCSENFAPNSPVTLIVVPQENSVFAGWSEPQCGEVLTMTQDLTCTANFALVPPQSVTLTIAKSGEGVGTVTSSAGLGEGIDCGVRCSENFAPNSPVTLSVVPQENSVFAGWSEPQCGEVLTMTQDLTCTANFTLVPPQPVVLTIAKSGEGVGTVTSSAGLGEGIDCGVRCSENFAPNSPVTLIVVPQENSVFAGWSEPQCGEVLTMTQDLTCTANFALAPPQSVTLTIAKSGEGVGTVTSSAGLGEGIDCGVRCSENFTPNSPVTLSVIPQENSVFSGWSEPQCGEVLTMTQDLTCTANFTLVPPQSVTLTIAKSGEGVGTVTSSAGLGEGIDCGVRCSENFAPNSPVTLSVVPQENSVFAGWSEPQCGEVLTMTQDLTCTANFTLVPPQPVVLTIAKSGEGSGRVTSSAGLGEGIDCGVRCSENFAPNSPVTLSVVPQENSVFAGWSEPQCGEVLTMTQDLTCTANFALVPPQPVTLTIAKSGEGVGTVTSSAGLGEGIDCGVRCSENFAPNSPVTLSVIPQENSVFAGWSEPQCGEVLTMTQDLTCTANFALVPPQPVTLTIAKSGEGVGTVTSSAGLGEGIDCGVRCSENFAPNSPVTLIVVPQENSVFAGWSEPQCGEVLTMTQDLTCTANFALVSPIVIHTLKILKVGITNGGVVKSSTSTTIDCGSTCSFDYPEGSTVTLIATPTEGYEFIGWGGQCSGTDNPLTVTLDTDKTCIAGFDSSGDFPVIQPID